jgi:hypothetical protein
MSITHTGKTHYLQKIFSPSFSLKGEKGIFLLRLFSPTVQPFEVNKSVCGVGDAALISEAALN